MSNRLIHETSLYLLQHSENPVDWYPWCDEALEKSKLEDKPILLSVGYSSCHWCHVMEKESFEDDSIAQIMNEHFVNIKVDREERPDLDYIYMSAVQSISGQGGWPMTVFLTPEMRPFFAGTYFPPEDRRGMPGFPKVLLSVSDAFSNRRDEVKSVSESVVDRIEQINLRKFSSGDMKIDSLINAKNELVKEFDWNYGGTGSAPKFPQPMIYEFLLRRNFYNSEDQVQKALIKTLDSMMNGGIYDQLRGGFHRYSTDTFWLIPHFEKMLYDNALLAKLYLHAYQTFQKPEYSVVAMEILDYVREEMLLKNGGVCSSQDADSNLGEGIYFAWKPDEIDSILGNTNGDLIKKYFGVTHEGNFEGHSILSINTKTEDFIKKENLDKQFFESLLVDAKEKMLAVRSNRDAPGTDDKVLCSWNSLMISSYAKSGISFGNDEYISIAKNIGGFIEKNMIDNGELFHSYGDGLLKSSGYLEDYSFFGIACLDLHEATLDTKWLSKAIWAAQQIVEIFWDREEGMLFDTSFSQKDLIIRPRDIYDNAMPCGSSIAAELLFKVGLITGDEKLSNIARSSVENILPVAEKAPVGLAQWLCSADMMMYDTKEIVIIGDPKDSKTFDFISKVNSIYLPSKIVVVASDSDPLIDELLFLKGKKMHNGLPTAFVCQNYECKEPTNDLDVFSEQLIAK